MPTRITRRALVAGAAALPLVACVRTASKTATARPIAKVVGAVAHKDGAGVALTKFLGHRALPLIDPFLMLDRFRSRDPSEFERGFPDHPHRGFETVSIVLDGHVQHADSVGNQGDIARDAVQWMTAGKGIVHSEMLRASTETGALFGYQLWINLPAKHKWTKPRYQDIHASAFDTVTVDDALVRVLAGSAGGAKGAIRDVVTDPTLLDVKLERGARFRHVLPPSHAAFVVAATGTLAVGGVELGEDHLGVLGAGDVVELHAASGPARVLLFAAAPIGEPVARRGPFVMNTDDEIRQAYDDYRSGRLVGG